MRWPMGQRNRNVGDRCSSKQGRTIAIAGAFGTLVLASIVILLGDRPMNLWKHTTSIDQQSSNPQANNPSSGEEQTIAIVSDILTETTETWTLIFQDLGGEYQEPTPVFFSESIDDSACGFTQAASGLFYCPSEEKVYIDLSIYEDLKTQDLVLGDFAQTYSVAHIIGHHVQHLLGISENINQLYSHVSDAEANQLAVRLELQADCLAGIWAHHADQDQQIPDPGNIEKVIATTSAIGDSGLQNESGKHTTPDSLIHDSSEQRVHWFQVGLETGQLNQCDTFSPLDL